MEKYVKIVVLENDDEARLVESILTDRAIPHMMKSYYDTAFDGLFQTQKACFWARARSARAAPTLL